MTNSLSEMRSLAMQHHQAGRLQIAEQLYRQILQVDPNDADINHYLGVLALQVGRFENAVEHIGRAVQLNGLVADFHNNLGEAYRALRRFPEAAACYRRALELNPTYAGALCNLGTALNEDGKADEGIGCYRRALELRPDLAEAHCNLGKMLNDQGKSDEAVACYLQALRLRPQFAMAQFNLGVALHDQGKLDEAMAAYRRALELNADYVDVHNNMGGVWKDLARSEEAINCYRRALQRKPDSAEVRLNLAMMLLLQGDFAAGWAEHEWRWKSKAFTSQPRGFPQPQWDGSPLQGRTILLHAEQGFGDTLQFVRYVGCVAQDASRVVVECQPQLLRLLKASMPGPEWIAKGQPLPPFDVHCPLMSLPRVFGTTLSNIPAQTPPLQADPGDVERWKQRFAGNGATWKVGLVWAGRPTHTNDRNRSLSLATMEPLVGGPDVTFYSLQIGDAAQQAHRPPAGMRLVDWTGDLHDFADTAALIANLDLVIAVDTAVAHLAGAMGKPVWTLLPFAPDWRWLLGRDDSPWYPTMRLFRQEQAGDWLGVVRRVAAAIQRFGIAHS